MKSVKCPGCGASLTYNLGTQKLECVYCGVTSNINEEKMEEDIFFDNIEMMNAYESVCPGCGAKLIMDINTISTKCAYCKASLLANKKMTKVFKPEKIILFEIDEKCAKSNVKRVLKENTIFVDEETLNELKPIYLPYWLYNCITTADFSDFKARVACKGVLVDASNKVTDALSDKVDWNFRLEKLKKFEISMIAGHTAEKYDVAFCTLHNRIKEKMRCELDNKYNRVCSYTEIEYYENYYVLLPFYYLNFNGSEILVNGQTGAVVCSDILNMRECMEKKKQNFETKIAYCFVFLIMLLCFWLIIELFIAGDKSILQSELLQKEIYRMFWIIAGICTVYTFSINVYKYFKAFKACKNKLADERFNKKDAYIMSQNNIKNECIMIKELDRVMFCK